MPRSTIVLFDVDGTLTASRKEASPEMIEFLKTLRGKVRRRGPVFVRTRLAVAQEHTRNCHGAQPHRHLHDAARVASRGHMSPRASGAARAPQHPLRAAEQP
jgi:phosphoserine phosphatase